MKSIALERLTEIFDFVFADEEESLPTDLIASDLLEQLEIQGYVITPRESCVKEFHEAFGQPIRSTPTVPSLEERILRVKLLYEEVLEFAQASGVSITAKLAYEPDMEITLNAGHGADEMVFSTDGGVKPDIVGAADALADIRYVTDGANLTWGFPQEELLDEVHASNMSKLGEDGEPIYREDGKIMKGPNFKMPSIEVILKDFGCEN